MFLKPYRVKSNTQLKTSDKKKLRLQFCQQFPALPEEEVHKLLPLKEDVSTMKIFCHKGEPSLAYHSNNAVMAFTVDSRMGTVLLPSLYLCWKYPDVSLAPTFFTHADVLPRMQSGADLMMPGVIYRGQLTQTTFGQFEAGTPAVVVLRGAIVAVGTTALSSTDLYMAGGHGKAVIVAHVFGDQLWSAGNKSLPNFTDGKSSPVSPLGSATSSTPDSTLASGSSSQPASVSHGSSVVNATMGRSGSYAMACSGSHASIASSMGSLIAAASSKDHHSSAGVGNKGNKNNSGRGGGGTDSIVSATGTNSIGSASPVSGGCLSDGSPSYSETISSEMISAQQLDKLCVKDNQTTDADDDAPPQVLSTTDAMDGLLLHCFLKAVQQSKASLPLPLLVSNFYRLHVLPACPDDATLDVKKSSYKKLNKFLRAMEEKGILQITEHPKGVENITSVNYTHEDVINFRYYKLETTKKVSVAGDVFMPPVMEEVYQVSGDTIDFYRACGKSKGDVLTRLEVREIVTSYIKKKKLVNPDTKMVSLEPPLHGAVIAPKEGLVRTLKWDQIFSRLLGRMSPAVRIQRPGFMDIIKKGKIEPIEMTVVKRAGNKKVTLVYNVGHFGITESEFARQIQHMAAASTSVGPAEHKPPGTIQILVQGNATGDVAKLLLDTYNIPKKYIKGLELIPKGKFAKK